MTAILREQPGDFEVTGGNVPPELRRIVTRCLEKKPTERFQSAQDLAFDLRSIATQNGSARTGQQREASRTYLRWVTLGGIAVVVAMVAVWQLAPRSEVHDSTEEIPRIVVLPFDNLGSPDDEYFADGMTEEIISRLSAVSGLHVISRTSAMHYKRTDKAIDEIGEELNVQYALEGTVRWERAGEGYGRVRITPQLIKVADDRDLWSERYDRAIESVFEVQSDIASQVVEQLHVSLLKPEEVALDARPTDNPEAYQAYLRGLHYSTDPLDLKDVKLSAAMLERAVELDPGFAVAWAHLSRESTLLYSQFGRSPERREAARRAAERALEIDPSLPEGHWALGIYYFMCHRDDERALGALNRALAIRPSFADAKKYVASVLSRQGRWAEAIEQLNSGFALDPKNVTIAIRLSASYHWTRDFQQADRFIDLSISLAPDVATGYFRKCSQLWQRGKFQEARQALESAPVKDPILDQWMLELDLGERRFEAALAKSFEIPASVYVDAWGQERGERLHALEQCRCYHFLGDRQGVQTACGRARLLYEEMLREDPEFYDWSTGGLGAIYAYLGLKDEAIREAKRGVALLPVSRDALGGTGRVLNLAQIYAWVDEPDAAIDQLEYLLSIPGHLSVGALRHHPDWDPLRDHPRFQALLEKYDTD
jgi:serine/threonine-protein kinase